LGDLRVVATTADCSLLRSWAMAMSTLSFVVVGAKKRLVRLVGGSGPIDLTVKGAWQWTGVSLTVWPPFRVTKDPKTKTNERANDSDDNPP